MSGKFVTLGEIMMRLSTPDYGKIEQSNSFLYTFGGCEANVAVSLSHLGHRTSLITKLPENEIGDSVIMYLKSHSVDTEFISRGSSTMGIYFLESGFGGRPSKVIYNRRHSAFTRISLDDYDLHEVFKDASWFHVSGITLSLNDQVREFAYKAIKVAHEHGVKTSFDFNYRSRLLPLEEAKEYFPKVLPYVDVLFTSPFDLTKIVGYDENLNDEDLFRKCIGDYGISYIFTKKRKVFTATENSLKTYVYTKDNCFETDEIRFQIFDRIGAGDAFASGVIHILDRNFEQGKRANEFGLLTSVLKQTVYGDVSIFKEEDVLEYERTLGHQEVKR